MTLWLLIIGMIEDIIDWSPFPQSKTLGCLFLFLVLVVGITVIIMLMKYLGAHF